MNGEFRVLCFPAVPTEDSPFYRQFLRCAEREGKKLVMVAHTPKYMEQVFTTGYIVFDEAMGVNDIDWEKLCSTRPSTTPTD